MGRPLREAVSWSGWWCCPTTARASDCEVTAHCFCNVEAVGPSTVYCLEGALCHNRLQFTASHLAHLHLRLLQTGVVSSAIAATPGCFGDFLSLMQYLFCSAYLSAKQIRAYGGLSLVLCGQVIRPKRFSEYLDKCDSMTLMRYVIERCQIFPKCVFINCISSARSSLFRQLRVNEENMQALQRLLHEVRQVEFAVRTGFRMYLRAQEHIYLIVESVLSSQNPKLESLTIQAREAVVPLQFKPSCATLVKGILTDIAPLFVKIPRRTDAVSPSKPTSAIVPYHGLKKLNISTTGIWKPGELALIPRLPNISSVLHRVRLNSNHCTSPGGGCGLRRVLRPWTSTPCALSSFTQISRTFTSTSSIFQRRLFKV